MTEEYKELYLGGEGEIVEKKSRFIATTKPVKTEAEAIAFIEEMKKKYWDARHNCSAFVIGSQSEIARCSDDGEPGGTAGRPMLEVLLKEEIHNIAVVVTRYFGGTLLGTGGLIRAYEGAVKQGLFNSQIIIKYHAMLISIKTDYNGLGKIQFILSGHQCDILKAEYTEAVELETAIPVSKLEQIRKELIETTNGTIKLEERQEIYAAKIDGKVLIFDQ
ncbi:MAG: YigZ family protein [Clostridia bacterium]|nr:YigZ family protein [Clostridia bacterium]